MPSSNSSSLGMRVSDASWCYCGTNSLIWIRCSHVWTKRRCTTRGRVRQVLSQAHDGGNSMEMRMGMMDLDLVRLSRTQGVSRREKGALGPGTWIALGMITCGALGKAP